MQHLLSYMRRAVTDYNMIENGDRVAVGVSGGKDSVALCIGLERLRRFLGVEFTVAAITIDPCFGDRETDYTPLHELFAQWGIEYSIKRTNIGPVVFDVRHEEHPCSLCARMRRGALHDEAKRLSCNKIALGHHQDDALETFFMNLFHEGRLGLFSPVTYLSRKDLTMVRPLVYAPEAIVSSAARREGLPIVKSECPVDGATERSRMKEYLHGLERADRGLKNRVFGAIKRAHLSGF